MSGYYLTRSATKKAQDAGVKRPADDHPISEPPQKKRPKKVTFFCIVTRAVTNNVPTKQCAQSNVAPSVPTDADRNVIVSDVQQPAHAPVYPQTHHHTQPRPSPAPERVHTGSLPLSPSPLRSLQPPSNLTSYIRSQRVNIPQVYPERQVVNQPVHRDHRLTNQPVYSHAVDLPAHQGYRTISMAPVLPHDHRAAASPARFRSGPVPHQDHNVHGAPSVNLPGPRQITPLSVDSPSYHPPPGYSNPWLVTMHPNPQPPGISASMDPPNANAAGDPSDDAISITSSVEDGISDQGEPESPQVGCNEIKVTKVPAIRHNRCLFSP